ncbi:MAG: ribosome small subunit-dependent GTPase A [bacterium]
MVRSLSGRCLVRFGETTYRCQVRGRLKQGPRQVQTVVVIGDRVLFRPLADRSGPQTEVVEPAGIIEEVLPRRNKISRQAARRSGGRVEQILMANLDQIVAVQSLRDPPPQTGFIDRLLVAAERFEVAGLLCLNKIDLVPAAERDDRWSYYASLGYQVIQTSVVSREGVAELQASLGHKISLFLGASGVGKSSLLNTIQPELRLRIAPVGEKTGLGKHTTTRSELFTLPNGGYLADSPGIRGFDPWDIAPDALRGYFPDWLDPAQECRFRSCLHRDEPDCGVKKLVKTGSIPEWRHEAYLAILRDLELKTDRPYR